MIAIIDYGMGNLRSVQKACERVGHPALVTGDPSVIRSASHVILPGVGAFRDCMANLDALGLRDSVLRAVQEGKPFLGICLGLQLLFSESEEFGRHEGLGVLKGRVVRFPAPMSLDTGRSEEHRGEAHRTASPLKVPHMGWNTLRWTRRPPICEEMGEAPCVYFVHSYYVVPEETGIVAATTDYGVEFVSAVWKDNLVATQFHPEKSQAVGLALLKRFGSWRW
jgi:glutamine amidotransferase